MQLGLTTSDGVYLFFIQGQPAAAGQGWSFSEQPDPLQTFEPVRTARQGYGQNFAPMTASLALVGWLVEYVAWTIGFGAVALARFNRSSSAMVTVGG